MAHNSLLKAPISLWQTKPSEVQVRHQAFRPDESPSGCFCQGGRQAGSEQSRRGGVLWVRINMAWGPGIFNWPLSLEQGGEKYAKTNQNIVHVS